MELKKGVRVIAIDDLPIVSNKVKIIGVIFRDGNLEGVISGYVEKDGGDSTENIIKMISKSKFLGQVKVVVLHSLLLGGLNLVDLEALEKKLKVIAIAVTKKKPRKTLLSAALKRKFGKEYKKKVEYLKNIEAKKYKNFFVQGVNLDEKIKRINSIDIITPIRIAHKIATGIGKGESDGRL